MNTTIKTNAIYTKTLQNGTVKTILVVDTAEPDEKNRARYAIKDAKGNDSLVLAKTLATYEYNEEATKALSKPAEEPKEKVVKEPKEKTEGKRTGKRSEAKAANLVAVLQAVNAAGGVPSNSQTKPYRVSVKRDGKRIAVMDVCSDHIVVELNNGQHHGDHILNTEDTVWVATLTSWLMGTKPFRIAKASK